MPPTTPSVRPLGPDDARASRRLSREAFGFPPGADSSLEGTGEATGDASGHQPVDPPPYRAGMRLWGLFDGPELVAQIADREYDSWFGGRPVPTSGVAAVAVSAEHRGKGLLTPLFSTLLENVRNRGAAISTLFPSAAQIYRRFGYEVVGQFDTVEVSTSEFGAVRPAGRLRTRRAVAGDVEAVRKVYDAWAAAQNGPLTRRGPSFPAGGDEVVSAFTGVTLAVDETDRVHGYASWHRGSDVGPGARLTVADLVSTSDDATRALVRALGSFASVTPRTRIDTSGEDVVRYVLPSGAWDPVARAPYMLRVVDPAAAFGLRRYPSRLAADVVFGLTDEFLTDLDGAWRLSVRDGSARCERTDDVPRMRLTGRGLALSYAGSQGTANLRMAGLLSGDDADDATWDTLLAGRQVHIRDYF